MAINIRKYADAINQSRLAVEEGRIVFILSNGKREEHPIDGEVVGKVGMGIFSDGSIEWSSNGQKKFKESHDIKSINGLPIKKYEN